MTHQRSSRPLLSEAIQLQTTQMTPRCENQVHIIFICSLVERNSIIISRKTVHTEYSFLDFNSLFVSTHSLRLEYSTEKKPEQTNTKSGQWHNVYISLRSKVQKPSKSCLVWVATDFSSIVSSIVITGYVFHAV